MFRDEEGKQSCAGKYALLTIENTAVRDCATNRNCIECENSYLQDMPTYEYKCEKCNGTFEFFQSMKDEPLTECPQEKCLRKRWGHGKVKRLLGSGAGLIFKGSGFYITDYRSEGYQQAAKKEAESTKPPESKPSDSGKSVEKAKAAKPTEKPASVKSSGGKK